MSKHADGWKDEEGDVNDSKELSSGGMSTDAALRDVAFTFIMKDLTPQDVQDVLTRIRNYFGVDAFAVSPA